MKQADIDLIKEEMQFCQAEHKRDCSLLKVMSAATVILGGIATGCHMRHHPYYALSAGGVGALLALSALYTVRDIYTDKKIYKELQQRLTQLERE